MKWLVDRVMNRSSAPLIKSFSDIKSDVQLQIITQILNDLYLFSFSQTNKMIYSPTNDVWPAWKEAPVIASWTAANLRARLNLLCGFSSNPSSAATAQQSH